MDYQEQIDYINRENAFMTYNHIRVAAVEDGKSKVIAEIDKTSLNVHQAIHGGVYYTMADCAAGAAARSDGRKYVRMDADFHYLHGTDQGPIQAVGSAVHRGKTLCVVNVEITGPDGQLLAMGTFTMFCLGE